MSRTEGAEGVHQCKLDSGVGYCSTEADGTLRLYFEKGVNNVPINFCPVCGVSAPIPYTMEHFVAASRLVDQALIQAKGKDAGGVLRQAIAKELARRERRR